MLTTEFAILWIEATFNYGPAICGADTTWGVTEADRMRTAGGLDVSVKEGRSDRVSTRFERTAIGLVCEKGYE